MKIKLLWWYVEWDSTFPQTFPQRNNFLLFAMGVWTNLWYGERGLLNPKKGHQFYPIGSGLGAMAYQPYMLIKAASYGYGFLMRKLHESAYIVAMMYPQNYSQQYKTEDIFWIQYFKYIQE